MGRDETPHCCRDTSGDIKRDDVVGTYWRGHDHGEKYGRKQGYLAGKFDAEKSATRLTWLNFITLVLGFAAGSLFWVFW